MHFSPAKKKTKPFKTFREIYLEVRKLREEVKKLKAEIKMLKEPGEWHYAFKSKERRVDKDCD